jgi:hypothetical protein
VVTLQQNDIIRPAAAFALLLRTTGIQRKRSSGGLTSMFAKLVSIAVNHSSFLRTVFENCMQPFDLLCSNHLHPKSLKNGHF